MLATRLVAHESRNWIGNLWREPAFMNMRLYKFSLAIVSF